MREPRHRLGIGGGVSAATHGLGAMLLSLAPPMPHAPVAPVQEVALVIVAPAPTRETRIEDAVPRPSIPMPPGPIRPRPSIPARVSREPLFTPPEDVPEPGPPEPSLPDRTPVSLDPVSVARGIVMSEGPGPSMPGPPAPRDLPSTEPIETAAEAVHRIAREMGREARVRPFHPREAPVLVARADGSLTWTGPNFSVVVRPDGELAFSDQSSLTYDWPTGSGTIDFESIVIIAAGQDPFVAERIWFVEQTADVRE